MKHEWVTVNQGKEGIFNHGKRRCELCGSVQTKESLSNAVSQYAYDKFGLNAAATTAENNAFMEALDLYFK